jgi:hypothetical protein
MKTPMFLFACSLVALLSACKDKEKAMADVPAAEEHGVDAGTPVNTDLDVHPFGGPGEADSLVFMLERTPCFGKCKAYRVHIYRSGYATYEGRSHVEKEGMYHGRVDKALIEGLLADAERIGFLSLEDKYDGPVTDLPSMIVRIVAGGKDKKVVGRVGTPEKFRGFVERAEAILLPLDWKPLPAKD